MAKNWMEMANRLRANQNKNLRDYAKQEEKSESRILELNELQSSMDRAFRAGKGRR